MKYIMCIQFKCMYLKVNLSQYTHTHTCAGEDEFEPGIIKAYTIPPELPDVMKPQEGTVPPAGLSSE